MSSKSKTLRIPISKLNAVSRAIGRPLAENQEPRIAMTITVAEARRLGYNPDETKASVMVRVDEKHLARVRKILKGK